MAAFSIVSASAISAVATNAAASFGAVLRCAKSAIHDLLTTCALRHSWLPAITSARSAFAFAWASASIGAPDGVVRSVLCLFAFHASHTYTTV